jgi:teichuronic acid biosynthesis glycosyltransferase TuaC
MSSNSAADAPEGSRAVDDAVLATARRVLSYTTLYPNDQQPAHGIFVQTRLRHLAASGGARVEVVAPVPWFPLGISTYGVYARICAREERFGIPVTHPRYPVIPKIGMTLAPTLLAAATAGTVRGRARATGAELIDAHYLYPDGVAAAWIADRLDLPLVMTARGTDVNLIPEHALPRRMILWAAARAAAIICVCQALKDRLVELGVPETKVHVLRNGVDLAFFHPLPRETARRDTGTKGRSLLSVGHLIERKGHHLVIAALRELPADVRLTIVGSGPWELRLRELTRRLGLDERVSFAGSQPQERLRSYYAAADALVLASSREGMANVLLESLACGTPVVATPAWGTPEVIDAPAAGRLAAERSEAALATALRELLETRPDRTATRRHAERFSWEPTTRGQLALFERVVREHRDNAGGRLDNANNKG